MGRVVHDRKRRSIRVIGPARELVVWYAAPPGKPRRVVKSLWRSRR